jgi:hypothetical protein
MVSFGRGVNGVTMPIGVIPAKAGTHEQKGLQEGRGARSPGFTRLSS